MNLQIPDGLNAEFTVKAYLNVVVQSIIQPETCRDFMHRGNTYSYN